MTPIIHARLKKSRRISLLVEDFFHVGKTDVKSPAVSSLQNYLRDLVEDAKSMHSIDKQDIAAAIGISPQHLSNLLKGKNDWTAKQISALCLKLHITLFWSPDPKDDVLDLHRKLQAILDIGPPYSSGIQININCIHAVATGVPPEPEKMPFPLPMSSVKVVPKRIKGKSD